MVNAYTNTSVAVASSAAIPFMNNRYVVGCGSRHTPGSETITLSRPGYYLVNFVGDMTAAAGEVSVQLYNNGVAVPGALGTATVDTAGDLKNIGISSVVKVLGSCPCIENCANLTVNNTGLASTYSNAEITVVRLN